MQGRRALVILGAAAALEKRDIHSNRDPRVRLEFIA